MGNPSFNLEAFLTWARGFLTPMVDGFLTLTVPATLAYIGFEYLKWCGKDEEEKRQQSFFKSVKTAIIAAIVVQSASIILRIFGIA